MKNFYKITYGEGSTSASCLVSAKCPGSAAMYAETLARENASGEQEIWYEMSLIEPKNRKERTELIKEGYVVI